MILEIRMVPMWTLIFILVEIASAQILTIEKGAFGSPKSWLLQVQNHSDGSIVNETVYLHNNDTDYEIENELSAVHSSWFVEMPLLPIVFAESPFLPEGPCKRQTRRYLRELQNATLWATQMFDSSTKYPEGIINGYMRHLGHFDECYNIHTEIPSDDGESEVEEVNGRYCLVDIQYQRKDMPPMKQGPHTLQFDPNQSVWEAIREKGDFRRNKRYKLQMAICVPSVCSAKDVEIALRKPLEQIGAEKNMYVRTFVEPRYCQTLKEAPRFSTKGKIFCGFLLALTILVVISTWYDGSLNGEDVEGNSTTRDFLICFSARRNFKSIFEINYGHPAFDSTHLSRVILMTIVIIGHRMMQYYTNPIVNSYYLEKVYVLRSSMMIFNGPIITDSFFALGGLLITYGLLEELDKRKRLNFLGAILIRFLRLTPPYLLIICFYALVLPYLGSGPLWKAMVEKESERCATNWWSNLFYINNYVHENNYCMFQSWYLTVDFQLYVLALFIIYIFWRCPRYIGYTLLSTFIAASCIIPFAITYIYRTRPVFAAFPGDKEVLEISVFTQYYIKTHMRISAYFVGVISGAVIYDFKHSTWRLSKRWSRILFILLCVVLSITTQFSGHKYFDPNEKPTQFEAALYAALHRPIFAFGFPCAMMLLLTIGDGLDFHYNFLTQRWAQPLARLSYSAFLTHHMNQLYDMGIVRTGRTFSFRDTMCYLITDLAYTFVLSLLLAIGVEGPFRRIEKQFIMKRPDKIVTKQSKDAAVKKTS